MKLKTESFLQGCTSAFIWSGSLLFVVRTIYHIIGGHRYYLTLVEDDFYYYAVIARNIVRTGISSFDGATITNGYHPLWMGIVTLITAVTHSEEAFFVVLSLVMGLSFYITARTLARLIDLLLPGSTWKYIALCSSLYLCWKLIASAMETVLLLPILSYVVVIAYHQQDISNRKKIFLFSLLSSFCILARLDAVIIIVLLSIGIIANVRPTMKVLFTVLPAMLLGLVPLFIYFGYNYYSFGHFATVSSLAKQLPFKEWVHFSLFSELWSSKEGKIGIASVAIGCSCLYLDRRLYSKKQLPFLFMILIFPVVFFSFLALRSSWVLFFWYDYPFVFSIAISITVIGRTISHRLKNKRQLQLVLWIESVVLVAVCFQLGLLFHKTTTVFQVNPGNTFEHTTQLLPWIITHPGKYAMGDKAGLMAYMSGASILQLEGLASDYALLEHIQRSDALLTVLKEYRITYLIVSVYDSLQHTPNGYYIESPHSLQCGITTPKLSTYLQTLPMFQYRASNNKYSIFNKVTNTEAPLTTSYIFKIE